jgi:hypothetical protein
VPAQQLRREGELLAQRDVRRLRDHGLALAARGVAHVAEHDVAVGVLLHVEEAGRERTLDGRQRVQERAPAEEDRGRRLQVGMDAREGLEATARRLRIERVAVLRHVGPEEARQAFADRGRLGVVADQQPGHCYNL